ncbi:MAG: hypothetical protein DRJ35_01105 [Thermoprotei archaeon]|nr:MAG: hypothetical protein DRJ35_01105 [Thermoprotei archaeon]
MEGVDENIFFTDEGVWLKPIAEKKFKVGISDYLVDKYKEFLYIEFKKGPGEEFSEGEVLASLESLKHVFDLTLPFRGRVVGVNKNVEKDVVAINEKPMDTWLLEIEVMSEAVLKNLLTKNRFYEIVGKK